MLLETNVSSDIKQLYRFHFVVSIEIRWKLAGDINQITINKISFILIIRLFHIQHFVKRIHHGMFVTRLL